MKKGWLAREERERQWREKSERRRIQNAPGRHRKVSDEMISRYADARRIVLMRMP